MSLDLTRWLYDQPTGLLTNKLYADGKGTSYTYTSDGKLATRSWARGVTTTYAYDAAGALATIAYSDETPDVAFTYDRLGRMASATVAGVSTNLFTYDALDLVAETQNGVLITRSTDALGRPAGIALSASPYDVSYAYDAYGRFIAVTAQVHVLTHGYNYGYLADSDLVATMANSHGHTATRTYDPAMPHITRVHNGYTGGRTISQYDYTYDALGRRTAIANSGEAFSFSNANDLAAFNLYGYNSRSEVTSSRRYRGTDHEDTQTPVRGFSFDYDFDAIGNRTSAGTYSPANEARVRTYTANALNQYTQATVPGYASVRGTAVTNATVTVNGLPVWRLDEYFYGESPATNTASPAWQQMRIVAVVNPPGTNDPDVVSCVTGHVFVAQTPEAFTYDNDGNLTGDGRFTYTWDGENRLAGVETRAAAVAAGAPKVRIAYAYDHQSRRVSRRQYVWLQDDWSLSNVQAFRYDGWNLIAETSPAATNLYAWGLDLSGSLQGAGGIGGLLAGVLAKNEEPGARNLVAYAPDANGNVMQLVDATDGTLAAAYEYTPFGETIASTGPLAKANPFRFSTKWFDNDTGLGYWGYRWYGPGMGRWLSRDPMEETGGLNVYVLVLNAPVNLTDSYGLFGNPVCGPNGCYYPPDPCWGNCPDFPPPPPIDDNPCAWDEKMARATTSHKISLVHLLERLPGLKGKESLFNYFGFIFDCASHEKATGAYIAKTRATSDREELYYDTANPGWVPQNPKYECGGGSGKVSVQTRIWWKFLPDLTPGGAVFANLKTIVVVCYKCKCEGDCN